MQAMLPAYWVKEPGLCRLFAGPAYLGKAMLHVGMSHAWQGTGTQGRDNVAIASAGKGTWKFCSGGQDAEWSAACADEAAACAGLEAVAAAAGFRIVAAAHSEAAALAVSHNQNAQSGIQASNLAVVGLQQESDPDIVWRKRYEAECDQAAEAHGFEKRDDHATLIWRLLEALESHYSVERDDPTLAPLVKRNSERYQELRGIDFTLAKRVAGIEAIRSILALEMPLAGD